MSSRVQTRNFDRPDWYNAFDYDPEEAVRVRVRLLRELAATREPLVGDKRTSNAPHPAPHGLQCLSFSSVRSGICRFPQMVAGATTALLLAVDDTFR
jgi:hypothetical protein